MTIGEKIDQHCNMTIVCESDVTIVQKVDGNSVVTWHALSFQCPNTGARR
ncbi:MAG TPA: hypothetical protein VFA47_09110 [Candidatus Manganitrophaceae bacterium]|nr:hypothetical protein [Candidatus Manganitrophaceae bacterium]